MYGRVSTAFFLIPQNILVPRRIKVIRKKDFNTITKVVKKHKVVSSNPIKPCIQRNKLNDSPQNITLEILDRVHLICINFFVSIELQILNRVIINMGDDPHINRILNSINLNSTILPRIDYEIGNY